MRYDISRYQPWQLSYMTRPRNICWTQTGNQVLYQSSRTWDWYRTGLSVRVQQICKGLVILTKSLRLICDLQTKGSVMLISVTSYVTGQVRSQFCQFWATVFISWRFIKKFCQVMLQVSLQSGYRPVWAQVYCVGPPDWSGRLFRGEERWGGVEMFNLCSINVHFMLLLYSSSLYENSNFILASHWSFQ